MSKNEVRNGAILSYIIIFVNTVFGLVIAPYLLSTIGNSEYGVYKTIGSMTASLSVLELGMGGTLQRYIAKFNALKEKEKSYNFSAMALIQACVLIAAVLVVGFVLYFSLTPTYEASFTSKELLRAQQIYVLQVIFVALHIVENVLNGIISGYNRFVFANGIKLSSLLLKILLYFVVLPIFKNSLTIVAISLFLEVLIIITNYIYVSKFIGHKIHLYRWDMPLFKESFVYTFLLFIQSLIIQFNGNIDNIVIGAVLGTSAVTVYSFAIQIFSMYETCATSISGVVLPTVTNQIHSGATPKDLENTVEKFGRAQWMFLGAALFGFMVCGKEFFYVWLGKGFEDCWYLAMILMVPVTFPLVVNVCLAILKAKNMLKFRTVSLAYSVVINAILTIIGTRYFGYWAAAIGTAASTIVGSIISMNIFYWKKLNINILKLYFRIFGRITPCLCISALIVILINRFIYGTWVSFILKVVVFIIMYAATMLLFGLSKEEKQRIPVFKRG